MTIAASCAASNQRVHAGVARKRPSIPALRFLRDAAFKVASDLPRSRASDGPRRVLERRIGPQIRENLAQPIDFTLAVLASPHVLLDECKLLAPQCRVDVKREECIR